MGDLLSCDAVDMQDTVARYVSGQLTEDAAAAFEQHLEGCERCWAEVQLALQVRAATRQSQGHGLQPSRRRAVHQSRWFAAAAAAVVLAISGWWLLDYRDRATEVTRGGGGIAITAAQVSQGGVRLSWRSVEGAFRYRVAVSRADGTPLLTRDTDLDGTDTCAERTASTAAHCTAPGVARRRRARHPTGRSWSCPRPDCPVR